MRGFLVETALLTHGLPSITDADLLEAWECPQENIAWVEQGRAVIGNMERYLAFRNRKDNLLRIDYQMLDTAFSQGLTGALTASGTMALCQKLGAGLAVTCGMGGIGRIRAEGLCPDLPALTELPVALLATGPKDMLDVQATFDWLTSHGVRIFSLKGGRYTGYVFNSADVQVAAADVAGIEMEPGKGLLLLNPIPEEKRIADISILRAGIAAGEAAERQGNYYHPAVNGAFDRLSRGYSSKIQLESLVQNVNMAQSLEQS